MTQTFAPFSSGAGATMTDAFWQLLAKTLISDGVLLSRLNGLAVTANSSGMQVFAASGQAWVSGVFYQNDAAVTLAIAVSDPSNPRLDRVVLHLDQTAKTVALLVLTGTPSGSPVEPALTQSGTIWEIPLARVLVGATVATIAAGNVTDERLSVLTAPLVPYLVAAPYFFPGYQDGGHIQHTQSQSSLSTAATIWRPYHARMSNIPSSIALTGVTYFQGSSASATAITIDGFLFGWSPNATGGSAAAADWTTVGNCLRAVEPRARSRRGKRGAFTHHCDQCDTLAEGLSLVDDLAVVPSVFGMKVGYYGLGHECGTCGGSEWYATGLPPADEAGWDAPGVDGDWSHPAMRAHLVREAQRALDLPLLLG